MQKYEVFLEVLNPILIHLFLLTVPRKLFFFRKKERENNLNISHKLFYPGFELFMDLSARVINGLLICASKTLNSTPEV